MLPSACPPGDRLLPLVRSVSCAHHREEDAMDEAEMPTSDYEQKQRLMALARAHAAQLMDKMQALLPDERADFMQQQVLHAAIYGQATDHW